MTKQEAFKILCETCGEKFTSLSCRDYGSFYAFMVAPLETNSKKRIYVGSGFMCVDKRTKKVDRKEIYELRGKKFEFAH